jgi:hypothetical protein
MLLVLLALAAVPALRSSNPWATLLPHGPVAALIGALGTWFLALNDRERSGLRRKFDSLRAGPRNQSAVTRASAA